ncbi:MAG: NADH dehydrogenase, partial [Candidatus Azotimanducaceae bacterium]
FEAMPKILSVMSESASKHGLAYLEQLGVDVRLGAKVQDYDNHRLRLEDGSTFSSRSVIWTAGVKGNPVSGLGSNCINSGQRIEVDGYFRVKGTHNIFALGDVASCTSAESPKGLPMLAAVAVDQANYFAVHFRDITQGKACAVFHYKNRGVMATVGRNKAVVDLPHFEFHGPFAWFVWMFVHIWSLIGFRSKLVALLDWSINYLSFDRPLSLIIHPYQKPEKTDVKVE